MILYPSLKGVDYDFPSVCSSSFNRWPHGHHRREVNAASSTEAMEDGSGIRSSTLSLKIFVCRWASCLLPPWGKSGWLVARRKRFCISPHHRPSISRKLKKHNVEPPTLYQGPPTASVQLCT